MSNPENKSKNIEKKVFSVIAGLVLIFIGIAFLARNIFNGLSISKLWPLFMLIPVVFLLISLVTEFKKNKSAIIPVVILSTLSAYFLYLNYYGWYIVEFTWPVFLAAPGLGIFALFLLTRKWELLIPSSILLILAAFFYAKTMNMNILVGVVLIVIGISVFFKSIFKKKKNN